jgi:hypothetical protein
MMKKESKFLRQRHSKKENSKEQNHIVLKNMVPKQANSDDSGNENGSLYKKDSPFKTNNEHKNSFNKNSFSDSDFEINDTNIDGDEIDELNHQNEEELLLPNVSIDLESTTESSFFIALQVFFPFFAAGLGTVAAGLLLDHVQVSNYLLT